MTTNLIFVTAFLILPFTSLAASSVSCPSIADIQHRGGVYTSVDQHWLGVTQSGSGAIDRFDEATFYPDSDTSLQGRLDRCSYVLKEGQVLDMRYKRDAPSDVVVRIDGVSAWERRKGPFGIVYHLCKGPGVSACTFTEVR